MATEVREMVGTKGEGPSQGKSMSSFNRGKCWAVLLAAVLVSALMNGEAGAHPRLLSDEAMATTPRRTRASPEAELRALLPTPSPSIRATRVLKDLNFETPGGGRVCGT